MADLLYWIWLNTVITPGTETFAHLHAAFSSPEQIYYADESELRTALPPKQAGALEGLKNRNLKRAKAIMDYLVREDIGVVTYDDIRFPEPLRNIKNPPVLLYYRGTLPDFDMIFPVSIVGCREESEYATRHTFEISRDLALAGATVVSGMALGIDGVATAGALSGGGRVIEVLGSGIDVIYPKQHARLARLVERNGVILTEYPPGTPPFAPHFPKRNRIISALGRAVLVTAGKLDSGALITAAEARKQGKDIFALPGSIDDVYSEAPSLLLREGAKAAVCAEDILFTYEKEYPHIINLFRLLEGGEIDAEHFMKQVHVTFKKKKKEKIVLDKKKLYASQERTVVPDENGRYFGDPHASNRVSLDTLSVAVQNIYARIPENGTCTMDDLVSDDCPISHVTIAITKLSVAGYVRQGPAGVIERIP